MSVLRIGIGDLKVVRQKLVRYQRGEIAHIENVMKTETRKREHRRLGRKEETLVEEEEITEETERDLQTTERFEMERETAKTVKSDTKFDAGLTVSGSYGFVDFKATANFATSSSTIDATKTAAKYARSVTDRSASKVKERVREERTRKTISEVEEINTHKFDNKDGPGHISGIYQWVDKVYSAQIYNYGKRLMYEFIVPEPAAFYLHAQANKKVEGIALTKPKPPTGLMPQHLDVGTYEKWVAAYNVKGVEPPPPKVRVIGTTIEGAPEKKDSTKTSKELEVPKGYRADYAWVQGSRSYYKNAHLKIVVGRNSIVPDATRISGGGKLNDEDKVVPVAAHALQIGAYSFTVEARCKRSPEALEAWQLKTYASILDAYETKKAAYDAQIASIQVAQGTQIKGRNPRLNRLIENAELKRSCITMFTKETFDQFNAVQKASSTSSGYPEIDLTEAAKEGPYIQFLEQAFEWDQITYLFYPYFWARKEKWVRLTQLEDTDTVFTQFLQAGSARVVVPVREGYEEAVAYSYQTGKVWGGGGSPPVIKDPLYVSVISEIKSKSKNLGGDPEDEPWEVVVPTTLVILPDAKLPDFASQ